MTLGRCALRFTPRDLPAGVSVDQAIEWTRTHLEGKRLLLATIAFMVWDWLITLDNEAEFVWKSFSSSTVIKSLFVVNRYLPILHSAARLYAYSHENDEELSHIVSVHPVAASVSLFTAIGVSARRPGFDDKLNGILSRCGPVLDVAAYGSLISIAVVEIVLLHRLWAIYEQNKRFGYFLCFIFLAATSTAIAIRRVQPPDSFKLVLQPPRSLTICERSSPSELFFLYAIMLLGETMIFVLLLIKVWKLSTVGVAPILETMLKQGTQYYFVIFLALLFQVLGTILQPLFQPLADAFPVIAIASVACSRLVFSLRGLYATSMSDATTLQDFRAHPGTGIDTELNTGLGQSSVGTRRARLSMLRSQSGSKPSIDPIETSPDLEQALPQLNRRPPSPVLEVEGEATEMIVSPRRTRSLETARIETKSSSHAP